ncbi:MAG: SDR family oxidoreductase [Deltaproteobacteria bacterium]|nr:MAG: SDR family oxidoreductase [Deltaproteobacteria bacterium]
MKRVAVITGVSGGIGRATARLFAAQGWRVTGIDCRPGAAPEVHRFLQADLADTTASEQIFAEITAAAGRIDALINNAAVQICKPLLETTPAEWDAVMATNLRSVYLAIRHAHPLMRARGGAIVNVSSVHAVATSANIAAYAASKGALLALTRALAIEFSPDKIRVNAVLPGAVDTEMLRAGLSREQFHGDSPEESVRRLGARHVLGRVGRPEEIARAILFLADEQHSSFMTGQALIVDGGATARLSTE